MGFKHWRRITGFQGTINAARVFKLLDLLIYDVKSCGWHKRMQFGGELFELLRERHV